MLTAELVRVRRDAGKGELRVVPLSARMRPRALELAQTLLDLVREHLGRPREELEEAIAAVTTTPAERTILAGLDKLIEDRCEFDAPAGPPPEELRSEVFLRAAALRRAAAGNLAETFDRQAVLAAVAQERGLGPEEIERGLYADLRGAHLLLRLMPVTAQELVDGYDTAQAQAVLLRAVRLLVEVHCASAAAYRALFRKLKFLRLLYRIQPLPAGGYRIEIDGPFSLFESVTKYGLQLALALPAIQRCQRFALEADLRWGRAREPLRFSLQGGAAEDSAAEEELEAELPDEVAALVRGFRALATPWRVAVAQTVLQLPGVGLCVPDLVFERPGARVYLEVMGYWSRDAVWRRVELVQAGLREPILFALSERLRVSEQALPADLPAALYVYKGTISPRVVAERLAELSARSC